MSINSISGISGSPMTRLVPGGFRAAMQQAIGAVASQLGMSKDDLQDQLKSGRSLADIAGAKGVSATDLLATIKQTLSAAGFSGNSLDTMANRIANHKGGHHQHHGAGTQGVQQATKLQTGQSASSSSGSDRDGDNDGR